MQPRKLNADLAINVILEASEVGQAEQLLSPVVELHVSCGGTPNAGRLPWIKADECFRFGFGEGEESRVDPTEALRWRGGLVLTFSGLAESDVARTFAYGGESFWERIVTLQNTVVGRRSSEGLSDVQVSFVWEISTCLEGVMIVSCFGLFGANRKSFVAGATQRMREMVRNIQVSQEKHLALRLSDSGIRIGQLLMEVSTCTSRGCVFGGWGHMITMGPTPA